MSKTLLPPDHEHFIARSNNYGFQLTNVTHYVRTFELYLLFSLVFVPTAYTDCNLNWHGPRGNKHTRRGPSAVISHRGP